MSAEPKFKNGDIVRVTDDKHRPSPYVERYSIVEVYDESDFDDDEPLTGRPWYELASEMTGGHTVPESALEKIMTAEEAGSTVPGPREILQTIMESLSPGAPSEMEVDGDALEVTYRTDEGHTVYATLALTNFDVTPVGRSY